MQYRMTRALVCAGALLVSAAATGAQQPAGQQTQQTRQDTAMPANECRAMLEQYKQTLNQMQQAQDRAENLLAKAKTANTDEARLDAITETLGALVGQRGDAIDKLERINAQRIAHMMQATAGGSVACQMLAPIALN